MQGPRNAPVFSLARRGKNSLLGAEKSDEHISYGSGKVRKICQSAARHFHSLEPFDQSDRKSAIFYEFGAGWDLATPLSFYSLGVEREILVDIRKLVKLELLDSMIQMLQNLAGGLAISRIPN